MKKFYTLIALVLFIVGNAQNYNFVNTTSPYTNLTGAVSLNNGEAWDDPEYLLTLPFNFVINGISTNNVTVFDSYLVINPESSILQIISPLGVDLVDRGIDGDTSISPISYKIDGVAGSRIVKVEYNNCGSWTDDGLTMFVNFQIWLYETSNIIEFRYGVSSVPDPNVFYGGESGGAIGLTSVDGDSGELTNTLLLTGNAEAPTYTSESAFVSGTPSNGRLYRFTPTSLNVDSFLESRMTIYPNPANDIVKIDGLVNDSTYNIYDVSGKLLLGGRVNATGMEINVSQLSAGLYFLQINSNATIKFVKS